MLNEYAWTNSYIVESLNESDILTKLKNDRDKGVNSSFRIISKHIRIDTLNRGKLFSVYKENADLANSLTGIGCWKVLHDDKLFTELVVDYSSEKLEGFSTDDDYVLWFAISRLSENEKDEMLYKLIKSYSNKESTLN